MTRIYPMKVIVTVSLTLIPLIAGCREKESATVTSWNSSFRSFVNEVNRIASASKQPNAEEMHNRLNEIWPMTDGAGHVVDCNPSIDTLQYNANHLFAGQHFDWTIPFEEARWADSNHTAVLITVPLKEYAVGTVTSHMPRSIHCHVYGLKSLPIGNTLNVKGILGKPAVVANECQLSGVCVVSFPNNKENEYNLIVVINGIWKRFDSLGENLLE